MVSEIGPAKSFGTFEKQARGLKEITLSSSKAPFWVSMVWQVLDLYNIGLHSHVRPNTPSRWIKYLSFYSFTPCDDEFLNSLIIHDEERRKLLPWRRFGDVIQTIIKFGEPLLWISLRSINTLRSSIKHSTGFFIRYQNTSKLVKEIRRRLVFSTHFTVFGYLTKHSSFVFYI